MRVVALLALCGIPFFSVPAQQNRDSVDARRHAARAQSRFEQIRRQNLPRRYSGSGGSCDAHIGRFCQYNSEDDTIEANDPRAIKRARMDLLASLDSASRQSPRDGWITGQRIRYLLETRDDTAAVRVARECQGSRWWCSALEGLALQQTWNGAAADSAFARALREMPSAERCRWTDMTSLLDPPLKRKYGKVGCGKNESVAERLWWTADPFWSLEGNDRRTEHYARHTMARILEPTRIVYNLSWANDLRDMIVRYGWARYWTRGDASALDPNNPPVSGHEASPNYHFVPVAMADSLSPSYNLDLAASSERYAPVAARRIVGIDPQVAVFRRGDSAIVIAAFDVSRRDEFNSARVTAGFAVARNERFIALDSAKGSSGVMKVIVAQQRQMMSVEVIDSGARRFAAWKRTPIVIAPLAPGKVSMSDVLLFSPDDRDVSSLDSAIVSALGGTSLERAKVGLYWEIYGLARTDSAVPVSLTLTRVQQGTLRRIGESIGLGSKSSPLSIRWTQTMSRTSVTTRSVVLDFTLIPKGKYQLRVEAGSASATRLIELL